MLVNYATETTFPAPGRRESIISLSDVFDRQVPSMLDSLDTSGLNLDSLPQENVDFLLETTLDDITSSADQDGKSTQLDATALANHYKIHNQTSEYEAPTSPDSASSILDHEFSDPEWTPSITTSTVVEASKPKRTNNRKRYYIDEEDEEEIKQAVRHTKMRKTTSTTAKRKQPQSKQKGRKQTATAPKKAMTADEARLEKNRLSAKECRLRKKQYIKSLETKVSEFESREKKFTAELISARSLIADLQQRIAAMQRNS